MAAPDWPTSLPQEMNINGFTEQGADNVLRSENSIGPAKYRKRASSAPRPVSGSMWMTSAQLATFRTFVSDTIGDGALTFNFPAQTQSGTWLVRLTSPYQISYIGALWEVSMELEVLP